MGGWESGTGVVEFPDGRRVRGRGLLQPDPEGPAPEFGLYLLGRDPRLSDRPYRWVRWRDYGLPTSSDEALTAITEAHTRASSERVEIACAGGTGRTGTALAVMAALSGVAPEEAIAWVRAKYRPRAVETRGQRRWITRVLASEHRGRSGQTRSR